MCFIAFSSGAADRPGPGPGHRAQCWHHEGKMCQPAATVTDMVTVHYGCFDRRTKSM